MTARPWSGRAPLLIGHRGGALEAPENTLAAFRHARACGAHMLELDVHATADDGLVVLHDATLERTTDGRGPVSECLASTVRRLDAAHWFTPGGGARHEGGPYPLRGVATGAVPPPSDVKPDHLGVPTLAAVLDAFPGTWITLELKVGGLHEQVAKLLADRGREADVIVGGFATERLEAFRAVAPQVATSATESEAVAFWAWAHGAGPMPERLPFAALQVPCTHGGQDVVTDALVRRAHDRGIAVHVWTVDDPAEMHRLLDLGVDGIMTDRPSVLARVLAERER